MFNSLASLVHFTFIRVNFKQVHHQISLNWVDKPVEIDALTLRLPVLMNLGHIKLAIRRSRRRAPFNKMANQAGAASVLMAQACAASVWALLTNNLAAQRPGSPAPLGGPLCWSEAARRTRERSDCCSPRPSCFVNRHPTGAKRRETKQ